MAVHYRIYEQRLHALLGFWAVVFFGVALVQVWNPAQLVVWLNNLGFWVHWSGPTLDLPTNRFYSTLGISLLAVLIALCLAARRDLRRRMIMVRMLLLAKIISTIAYAAALWWDSWSFAYCAGALADGTVAVWTWMYYRHVRYVV